MKKSILTLSFFAALISVLADYKTAYQNLLETCAVFVAKYGNVYQIKILENTHTYFFTIGLFVFIPVVIVWWRGLFNDKVYNDFNLLFFMAFSITCFMFSMLANPLVISVFILQIVMTIISLYIFGTLATAQLKLLLQ